MRPKKIEDITILCTQMAFGEVKQYPNMLRANDEISDPRKRSFSLEWRGHPDKKEFKISQYDQSKTAFALRAKFYLTADSASTPQLSSINPTFNKI